METIPRFFTPPGESFFLFGPRGTGKSTFMKQRFPDALLYRSARSRIDTFIFSETGALCRDRPRTGGAEMLRDR